MSSRIERTVARQEQRIAEGNFYEAHQQLRVIATRYVKAGNWTLAIELLTQGALALLRAGQGGSGGDLCLYLIDVYDKSKLLPSSESKARIFTLFRAFPPDEPTFKRFANEVIGWSAKTGDFQNGDPEIHHIIGTIFVRNFESYEAEKHLVFGTRDSSEVLARLEFDWYLQDEAHTAPLYAARAVFPYLLTRNLRSANKAYTTFVSHLSLEKASLGEQKISSNTADIRLFPSMPLLNFIGLLLMACQRATSQLFKDLTKHYAAYLDEVGQWSSAIDHIGEIWFGLRVAKRTNPLLDMMGDMLFGNRQSSGGVTKSVSLADTSSGLSPQPAELD